MNNRGDRMKGEKIRVIIIYVLVIVIIALVGYLIYNFFINNKEDNTKKEEVKVSDIASECTFGVTSADYNAVVNGNNSNLCGGLNKLKINDIILSGTQMNVEVNYYNGNVNAEDEKMGFYINGKRILKLASNGNRNNIGVFDNKLFIFTADKDKPNVVVYDNNGTKVYDLQTALAGAKISDPAFVEIAKTNQNLDVVVKNSSINTNSFSFGPTEFTFATAVSDNCQPGTNIGSNYKVTFSGNNFSVPEFISFNVCNG